MDACDERLEVLYLGVPASSYKLIGVSIPGQNWWEDYGSPMMDNFAYRLMFRSQRQFQRPTTIC